MADEQGLSEGTSGKKFEWYGGGKMSIKAASDFDLTYGVRTLANLALVNTFTVGGTSTITLGSATSIKAGIGFDLAKTIDFKSASKGGFYHAGFYLGKVGAATSSQLAHIRRLEVAVWVLLGIQAGVLAAMAAATASNPSKTAGDGADLKLPLINFPAAYVSAIATVVLNLGVAAGIAFVRIWKAARETDAKAALSLDQTGTAFLGARATTGEAAGLLADTNGLHLASGAPNVFQYAQAPGGAGPIFGFDANENAAQARSARINLFNDGKVAAQAGLDMVLKARNAMHQEATAHYTYVRDTQGQAETAILTSRDGMRVKVTPTTYFAVMADRSINAIANGGTGGFLKLTGDRAVIGRGSNKVTITARNIEISYGHTTVKLDSTGVFAGAGNDFAIIAPGAAIPVSAESADIARMAVDMSAEMQVRAVRNNTDETRKQAARRLLLRANGALVAARELGNQAGDDANQGGAQ